MDNGEALYELGVDIRSDFTFENGDLKLSKYEENLVQAICNRLNTNLDELELFYEDYGSVLSSFIGWKANDETIDYMQKEIDIVLQDEPRIIDSETEITYKQNGLININLNLTTSSEAEIETNLILSKDGTIEIETDETEEEE